MRRRHFITLVGGAAASWPLAARAQQTAMPVIGFLHSTSMSVGTEPLVDGFRRGLKEGDYVDGQNAKIEFRWAEGQYDRLPGLAADLVSRQVLVLFAGGPPAALAAKAATAKIPIVFTSGDDPIKIGLVSNLARPEGNVTGVSIALRDIQAKRLELLRELIPTANAVGLIFNPRVTSNEDVEVAAQHLGLRFYAAPASTEEQLDAAFATLTGHRVDAILMGSDPEFYQWRSRIISLASRASMPTMYEIRGYVTDGGLMSYGASPEDAYHQAGVYVARILKGERPGNLPVTQPTKFDLVINLKTAKALGLKVPLTLQTSADEVIE